MSKKSQFEPRRAQPGQAFEYTDGAGRARVFHADEEGIVRPSNGDEERIADGFDLAVARKVQAEEKANEQAAEAGKERG